VALQLRCVSRIPLVELFSF